MRWQATNAGDWHTRFAWLPVRIGEQVVWLEPYETRLIWSDLWCDRWDYRLPGTTGPAA